MFGIRTWTPAGVLLWDTSTAAAGVIVDVFYVSAGASLTKTYQSMAGFTVQGLVLEGLGCPPPTTDTALGYPRVTVPSFSVQRKILVMAS